MAMISRRIVVISGFSQDLSAPTGLEQLWMKLRQLYECRDEEKTCRVSLHTWDEDFEAFTNNVIRTGPEHVGLIDLRVAAYSWGAGRGFVRLAEACKARGIRIHRAVLSDPVYHCWWMPWRALWSPLIGEPKIKVPSSVKEVWYLRQSVDVPKGHEVIAEKATHTGIRDYGYLTRAHS